MAKTKILPLQEQLHRIMRPISYGNPASPHYEQIVTPADGLFLDFPHLDDTDILLLRRMKAICPATEAEIEQSEADRAAAAAMAEAETETAANGRAAQKRAANQKIEVNHGKNRK